MREGHDYGQIVNGMRAGQSDALEDLVRISSRRLFRLCVSQLLNEADAEEAVQDAYVNAKNGIHKLKDANKLMAWLSRIAINACHSLRKKRPPIMQPEDTLAAVEDRDPSPAELASQHETGALMRRALDRLNDGQREVIGLHYFLGMKHTEIATLLDIKPTTVRQRCFQGLRILSEDPDIRTLRGGER